MLLNLFRQPAMLGRINDIHAAPQHGNRPAPCLYRRIVRQAVHTPRQPAHHGYPVMRQVFRCIPGDLFSIGCHVPRPYNRNSKVILSGDGALKKQNGWRLGDFLQVARIGTILPG